MADLSDVETAFLAIIQGAVYPNGTSSPSIVNADVRIYRGWPIASQLDADLAAGKCHVSVYSQPNVERNTTRYPRDDQVVTAPVHTLTVAVNGNQVTIGGTVATPQNVIVLCGSRFAFTYAVKVTDTLNSIASALAALIAVTFPGSSAAGAVITVAGQPGILKARVAGAGAIWTEQRRQERGIQVTCWCQTPALRDALAPAIDLAFAQLDRITLPDQSSCRIKYERTGESDEAQKVQIFRRDLFYTVEYPTVTTSTAFEVGALKTTETGGVSSDGSVGNISGGTITTTI